MPTIVRPKGGSFTLPIDVSEDEYAGRYPEGLDLRPGSELHEKILSRVLDAANDSLGEMRKKHPYWEKIEQTLTAYIVLSEEERRVKDQDETKPISIVMPLSFATLETLLTYFTSAFLNQPYFRYMETESNDVVKVALMEMLIQKQAEFAKMGLALHTMFRDSFVYGFGVVAPVFKTDYAFRTKFEERSIFSDMLRKMIPMGRERVRERVVKYEGNVLMNVDPYNFMPDPNQSVHDVQAMEYVGWMEETNYHDLLSVERDDEDMFNVRFLQANDDGTSGTFRGDSDREKKYGNRQRYARSSNRPNDVINMYFKLIPSEWGLGDEKYPEKWLFSVAADAVVIRAQPLGLDHDMFPLAVAAPDFDGYSSTPISKLEVLQPMQEAVDWFIRSHIANVRKAVNDMLIVDPYMVNMNDLRDPQPGKLVRLRRAAWGRGVKDAVAQLAITDVTRNHLNDISMLMSLGQQMSGTDSMQTVRRKTSERVSSAEARNDISNFTSKMGRMAKVTSMQAMRDLAYMLASHTRQLMTEPTHVAIVGDERQDLVDIYGRTAGVAPEDLDVNFDIMSFEDSVPGTEDLNSLSTAYQIIASNPELAQQFDTVRIFMAIAKAAGFKNVGKFRRQINPQVMEQAQLESQLQQGNIAAIDSLGNGGLG